MSDKDARLSDIIKDLAAKYVQRESNGISLITITDVAIADRGGKAIIYFIVLPEDKVKGVLDFLRRKRSDFREYVMENSRMGRIPFFDFAIDLGEKNRQKIDEISRSVVE